jgi:hypothetical protein
MFASTKLVDKLEGVYNFRAWKYRIALILEENDLARFIKENVLEPTDATAKAKYKKDMVRAKRIVADSVSVLIHTYKRGEVSNPLGVSLEA